MFELVCGNASHAVGRVRVCFSLWCCDLTDIPLADWSDTAAEWEYYGFWFAVLFALLVFQGHPLTGIVLTTLVTFATQSFSLSLSLLFSLEVFLNVYMIYTSLVSCLSRVCLSLFNRFNLFNVMFTSSTCFLSLFSCFFSLTVLNYWCLHFSHFLRVCWKSSELPYIGSYLLRQHANWKETF